jgi:hypothetical protein
MDCEAKCLPLGDSDLHTKLEGVVILTRLGVMDPSAYEMQTEVLKDVVEL